MAVDSLSVWCQCCCRLKVSVGVCVCMCVYDVWFKQPHLARVRWGQPPPPTLQCGRWRLVHPVHTDCSDCSTGVQPHPTPQSLTRPSRTHTHTERAFHVFWQGMFNTSRQGPREQCRPTLSVNCGWNRGWWGGVAGPKCPNCQALLCVEVMSDRPSTLFMVLSTWITLQIQDGTSCETFALPQTIWDKVHNHKIVTVYKTDERDSRAIVRRPCWLYIETSKYVISFHTGAFHLWTGPTSKAFISQEICRFCAKFCRIVYKQPCRYERYHMAAFNGGFWIYKGSVRLMGQSLKLKKGTDPIICTL